MAFDRWEATPYPYKTYKDPAVRILWLGALGLFLIWQPFVAGERQMNLRQTFWLIVLAISSTVLLGPWLLLIWCGALAAVIGGRVLWTGSRLERLGYLFAFGYLVCLTIFCVVPELSPLVTLTPIPREAIAYSMPALLPLLLFFQHIQFTRTVRHIIFHFVYIHQPVFDGNFFPEIPAVQFHTQYGFIEFL